ncbi:MAG: hypothetical protein H7Z41_03395 [Cytophagales bacterium]|nr:hypothetical protein [Armatimonadota bacterium]
MREEGTSYVFNEYVSTPTIDSNGQDIDDPEIFTSLDQVPRPSETMMLFEQSDENARGAANDHVHSRGWFNITTGRGDFVKILGEIEPDRHRQGAIPHSPQISNNLRRTRYDRTAGSANYLYCDTHVKSIPAARIKGWAESGFNFAKPLL